MQSRKDQISKRNMLSFAVGMVLACTTATSQSPATLESTTEFLLKHQERYLEWNPLIKGYDGQWVADATVDVSLTQAVLLVNQNKCNVDILKSYKSRDTAESTGSVSKGKFHWSFEAKTLDIANIKIHPWVRGNQSFVYVSIPAKLTPSRDQFDTTPNEDSSEQFLVFKDQESAGRMANAFRGLAHLCGAVDEPY